MLWDGGGAKLWRWTSCGGCKGKEDRDTESPGDSVSFGLLASGVHRWGARLVCLVRVTSVDLLRRWAHGMHSPLGIQIL